MFINYDPAVIIKSGIKKDDILINNHHDHHYLSGIRMVGFCFHNLFYPIATWIVTTKVNPVQIVHLEKNNFVSGFQFSSMITSEFLITIPD
jgi:hypothetical protein